jgi:glutathione S-transferase
MTGQSDELVVWGIGTSRTFRVHWALIELNLPYRTVPLQTRTVGMEDLNFLSMNPRKKIPVLQHGDLVLTESAAIVTYLAERYSTADRPLIPEGLEQRARYLEWMSFVCMELDATSLYVLRRHEGLPEVYGEAPEACEVAREYFQRMINAAAMRLNDGPYLLGRAFSGVDIMMVSVLNWAVRYGQPLPAPFERYRAAMLDRSTYKDAIEANTPR